jgi:hypothetical protein
MAAKVGKTPQTTAKGNADRIRVLKEKERGRRGEPKQKLGDRYAVGRLCKIIRKQYREPL